MPIRPWNEVMNSQGNQQPTSHKLKTWDQFRMDSAPAPGPDAMRAVKDYGMPATPEPDPAPAPDPTPNFRMLDQQSLNQPQPSVGTTEKGFEDWMKSVPALKFLYGISQRGTNLIFNGGQPLPGQDLFTSDNKYAAAAQDLLGYTALPFTGGAGLQGAGANLVGQGLSKFAPSLGATANKFLTGAAGQAALGAGIGAQHAGVNSLDDPNYTWQQGLKDVGTEAALFGGGDLALRGVGMGLKAGANKLGLTDWARGLMSSPVEGWGTNQFRSGLADVTPMEMTNPRTQYGSPIGPYPALPKMPLGLPPGQPISGYLPAPTDFVADTVSRVVPRKFTTADPAAQLNQLLEEIKPEVLKVTQEAKVPALESKNAMINYIAEAFPGVSRNEIRALDTQGLHDLALQAARERQVPTVIDAARKAAEKRGINLDHLLERATNKPSFIDQAKPVAERNRMAQAAGVMDRPKAGARPTVQEPVLRPVERTPSVGENPQPLQFKQTKEVKRRLNDNLSAPIQSARTVESELERLRTGEIEKPVAKPPKSAQNPNERGFINTLKESEKTTDSFRERLASAYKPVTNEEMVTRANSRIEKSIDDAYNYVMNSRKHNAEHVTTAHRLIDEYQARGEFDKAVDVAEKIAEAGTKAGQAVQAFSIYNRLTPQGILVHAGRIVNKINEKRSVLTPEAKVTDDMAAKLTDLASTVQTMTGTKEVANDVLSIVEKAKKGTKLTDDELKVVQSFVNDARKFIGDIAPRRASNPRPPKPINNKRVRDNVVDFLAAQEEAAKQRLREKGYRVNSGIPVDDFYDWSIIGASKLAKGTVKFADWSEQMMKEADETIQPYLQQVYDKAVEVVNGSAKNISRTQLSQVERITNKAINNKSISEAEAETLRKMAQKVAQLSGDAKIEASQELQAVLQILESPSIGQRISSVQTMAQLLNPKTLLTRNPIGNELFYRLERINKSVAAPVDWARVQFIGGQRSVTFVTHNQGEYWKNWLVGLKAGWKGVNPEGLATQYDLRTPAFSGKWNPLTYMEKTLGASLKSFDYAAYKRAVNHTVGELATLRAINEGLSGKARKEAIQKYIQEADDHILAISDEYGRYVTFQDNNLLSVGLQKFKNGLNLGRDFGIGDLIIKYPRTPGAILMRAFEYSPAGVLRSAYIAAKPWLRKGSDPNTREAMLALSRAIVGTGGLSAVGYFMTKSGVLTGAADGDKDVRELQRMSGQGQYRVNWDALKRWVKSNFNPSEAKAREGDKLISYDWAQPVAINASIGANISQEISKPKKEQDLSGILGVGYSVVEGAVNTLFEQSLLSGVKKAFETYPGQSATDKVVDILGDAPASFAPTLGNQVKQLTDNAGRSTYDPNPMQEVVNRVKNRIPGVASNLPPAYDTLGNGKETFQDGSNSLFNVFLNPSFTSNYKLSSEAKLVVDLIEETGDKSVAPRVPGKSITIKGNKYQLTPEEYSELQRRVGEETQQRLSKIGPNLSSKTKLERVMDALNEAGAKARKEIEKQHPEIKSK